MKKLETGFQNLILILLSLFMALILVSAVKKVPAGTKFLTSQIGTPQLVVCLVAVFMVLFLVILQHVIINLDGRNIWLMRLMLMGGMLAVQLVILLRLNVIHINDDFYVQDAATQIVFGMKEKIDTSGGYFAIYSNNDLAVLLTIFIYKISLLLKLSDVELGLSIFNLICIDSSILFLVMAVKNWKGSRAGDVTLLYCVMNPLNYILIHWTYTPTYSLPLMSGILLLAISIHKNDNWLPFFLKLALLGTCCSTGFFLRPTVLILAIAAAICFMLNQDAWGKKWKRWMLGIIVFSFAAAGTESIIESQINQKFEPREDTLFPVTHWLMIGMGDGYDYSYQAYTKSFPTKKEKIQGNLDRIKEMIQEYGKRGTLEHFLKKIPVCWDDGLMSGAGRNTYISEYSSIYQWIGGEKTDLLSVYAQGFRVAILLLAVGSVVRQLFCKKNRIMFLIMLSLFGGMLFYCFWETKSAYGIPFIPILLVISQEEAEHIKLKQYFCAPLFITMICFVLLWGRLYKSVVIEPFKQTIRTIWHAGGDASGFTGVSSEEKSISQEFYANHSFDNLGLRVNTVEGISCNYFVSLLNNNEMLKTWNISEKDSKKGWIYLEIGDTVHESKDPFVIQITGEKPGQADSLTWIHNISAGYDDYKGRASVGGNQVPYDFQLKVYSWAEIPYMGRKLYNTVLFMILTIHFTTCILTLHVKYTWNNKRTFNILGKDS